MIVFSSIVTLTLHHLDVYSLQKLGKPIDGGKVGEPCTSEQCEYLQRLSGPAWQLATPMSVPSFPSRGAWL